MYTKILIATDGTDVSEKSVTHGLALAKFANAPVILMTATEHWPPMAMAQETEFSGPEAIAQYEGRAEAHAEAVLAEARKLADEAGIACETRHVKDSHPAEGILKAAEDAGCDLIVMSTHGRRALDRLVLGSEAVEVLTHTKIPVLIVR